MWQHLLHLSALLTRAGVYLDFTCNGSGSYHCSSTIYGPAYSSRACSDVCRSPPRQYPSQGQSGSILAQHSSAGEQEKAAFWSSLKTRRMPCAEGELEGTACIEEAKIGRKDVRGPYRHPKILVWERQAHYAPVEPQDPQQIHCTGAHSEKLLRADYTAIGNDGICLIHDCIEGNGSPAYIADVFFDGYVLDNIAIINNPLL